MTFPSLKYPDAFPSFTGRPVWYWGKLSKELLLATPHAGRHRCITMLEWPYSTYHIAATRGCVVQLRDPGAFIRLQNQRLLKVSVRINRRMGINTGSISLDLPSSGRSLVGSYPSNFARTLNFVRVACNFPSERIHLILCVSMTDSFSI